MCTLHSCIVPIFMAEAVLQRRSFARWSSRAGSAAVDGPWGEQSDLWLVQEGEKERKSNNKIWKGI